MLSARTKSAVFIIAQNLCKQKLRGSEGNRKITDENLNKSNESPLDSFSSELGATFAKNLAVRYE